MSPIQPAENANSPADPAKPCVSQQTLLISYLSLRKAVGIFGFFTTNCVGSRKFADLPLESHRRFDQ